MRLSSTGDLQDGVEQAGADLHGFGRRLISLLIADQVGGFLVEIDARERFPARLRLGQQALLCDSR
jgi:hypothetical protein